MTGARAAAIVTASIAALVTVTVLAWPAALPHGAVPAYAAPVSAESSRVPVPGTAPQPPVGLDSAVARAADLQQETDDLKAESVALQARIAQTGASIYSQSMLVSRTRTDRDLAQVQFDDRVVSLYRAGRVSPIEVLLSSRTFGEALDRTVFLLSIIERDQAALQLATKLSAEATYQAKLLDDLRAQDVALRKVAEDRIKSLEADVAEQNRLVAQLNAQQKAYLEARSRTGAGQRSAWKASSYYGGPVTQVAAVVEPYLDRTYLVDQGEPLRYATTGVISTELCSWYGNAENGTATASGRAYNENELTCATVLKDPSDPTHRRLMPFGTRLALTRGDRRVIVAVTDRGPYVGSRTIDLSRAAAQALGFDGVELVNVEIVTPK